MPRTSSRLRTKASIKEEIAEAEAEVTQDPQDFETNDQAPNRVVEVVVKNEVIIKEEVDDTVEGEEETNEFSGYEYLLDKITVSSQQVKIELNESTVEENEDEDEDDGKDEDDDEDYDEDEDDYDYEDEDADDPKCTRPRKQDDSSKFSCFYCDFSCELKSDFSMHLKSHQDLNVHKCGLCNDVFISRRALKHHHLNKHTANAKTPKNVCKSCRKKFGTKKELLKHILNVHKGEKPFNCRHCSKRFACKAGLTQHMALHMDLRPFECKVCHAKFRSKYNKDSHMKAHFGIKEFQCDECGKEFLRKDHLKMHLISVHENKFNYSCSICNKSIKGHVLSHLRTHMQEKNHKCKECGKAFVQASQLKVHMRIHTGDRPFSCTVCKSTFAHSVSLKNHMYIHTGEKPAKCQLCPAAFTQLPHLKKHMKTIHKSDKPYVCAPCHKFFSVKAELTEHLSTRTCKASVKYLKK